MNKIPLGKSPRKILVVKPSSLGDIVHSMPFLQVMRETFPQSEIHWIVAKGLEGLLEGHPLVQRLWIIDKDRWKDLKRAGSTVNELKTLFASLRKEKFDLAVDLQGLLRSGILTGASRAPVRVGFSEAREGSTLFYTHRVRGCRDVHAVDRYLEIASALGGSVNEVRFPLPPAKDSAGIRKMKEDTGNYVVIVPGARWKTKIWAAERFGRVASLLRERSIIVGSRADGERAREIETLSRGKALSLAGRTDLRELIALIRDARFVITNDSGPMHIAAALGIPVVALFGPTNPVRTGPYGGNHLLITPDIPCAPCYKKKCDAVRCMDAITVEQVYQTIKERFYEIPDR
ncbi:MAG: lipopolysaccharide heptosyltransferase I [Alphaproteobacteria bacterium]|uniref:Lipopolysaccharide heptosyltransferase 1 n=1 Tax=Candidatus Nitrobium versatile TaxID=2884831 RepID=A0A953JEQ6_9BACT|nr:lipopolysaccharide heptosyltransferase I [Candidatus Nitrobium versatile]